MLRYLLISTVIVFTVAVIAAGWMNRDLIRIKIASVYAPAPPKPVPSNPPLQGGGHRAMHGDAPWVLSALPECLIQTSESTGPPSYTMPRLPAGSVAVTPPVRLSYGDCTISVTDDEAMVSRGLDLFRIPPKIRFYRTAATLSLFREEGGGTELRVYQPARP